MYSVQKWLLVAGYALVSACAVDRDVAPPVEAGSAKEQRSLSSWPEGYLTLGKETYERSCASCHDEGVHGAPAIGDRDAWAGRSPLWSAVLLEHAKSGYLDMPAKGGDPELTDHAVEAAGEYMLSKTFPELPAD